MVRVAINGLGRIGKTVLKICLERKIDVVAINDIADLETLEYLVKYDTISGKYSGKIEKGKDYLKIGNKKIKIFSEKDPENLPWKELKVDFVVESTGLFTDREQAEKHLKAGAKKVVLSAPGKNPDITVVLGVNDKDLKREHRIISLASCTTNCLAPVAKIIHEKYKIKKGFMTTVHAYTNDQKILDVGHKKLRRGRAGAMNLIPTSSGATTAVAEVIPDLKGKMDGLAIRAPVPCGSVVDFVAELKKSVNVDELNKTIKKGSEKLKGILEYNQDQIVSSDIIGNSCSSIFDSTLTQVNGKMIKVFAWYDNEFGYSNRVVDLLKKL